MLDEREQAGSDASAQAEDMTPEQRREYRRRLAEVPHVAQDVVTLARMTEIWCADHHARADRLPYDSEAVRAGAFSAPRTRATASTAA